MERYSVTVRWTGNLGNGTREYRGYSRAHELEFPDKPPIRASSGMGARVDPHRVNPEELLVGALASCHMLWYLHLCAEAGVVVTEYADQASGELELSPDGTGRFARATLRPRVVLAAGDTETARRLHEEAHRRCFIASSVNFPVSLEPTLERSSKVRGPEGP